MCLLALDTNQACAKTCAEMGEKMEQLHTFEIKDQFYLDGNPFRIISGGMHYFRVLPEYWEDRLLKLKALGCNTVCNLTE